LKQLFVMLLCILCVGCGGYVKKDMLNESIERSLTSSRQYADSLEQRFDDSICILSERVDSLAGLIAEQSERFKEYRKNVVNYAVPEIVEICGERVPMDDLDVRARVLKELYKMINDQGRCSFNYLLSKRYFPVVTELLWVGQSPLDLKYVPIVESSLNPKATSSAKAKGLWQFISSTGRLYQLSQSDYIDERSDLEESTNAAIRFLNDLYEKFGSWTLALAAYNSGPGTIEKRLREQRVESYWDLVLPLETEEYVPKIIATKLILEDPGLYGIDPGAFSEWERVESDTVTVKVRSKLNVVDVAEWTGTTYRHIRQLNPQLSKEAWPKGTYTITIPYGTREQFQQSLEDFRKGK